MGHLTSAKTYVKFDLITLQQKALRLIRLYADVMVISLRHQADLLELGLLLVLARFALFLTLLVAEFTVVKQTTNRRHRIGGHLNQIKATLLGHIHGLTHSDNANLCALIVNQAHLARANAIVDAKPIPNGATPSSFQDISEAGMDSESLPLP